MSEGLRASQKGTLDDLDLKIIGLLREDGRKTNVEIANELGVSDTTVRRRIAQLSKFGAMRVVAIVNPSHIGYIIDCSIAIQVEPSRSREVADQLSQMEEVRYLGFTSGSCDLLVSALFRSQKELLTFLVEKLGKIQGVQRTETTHILSVEKRTYDCPMPD